MKWKIFGQTVIYVLEHLMEHTVLYQPIGLLVVDPQTDRARASVI